MPWRRIAVLTLLAGGASACDAILGIGVFPDDMASDGGAETGAEAGAGPDAGGPEALVSHDAPDTSIDAAADRSMPDAESGADTTVPVPSLDGSQDASWGADAPNAGSQDASWEADAPNAGDSRIDCAQGQTRPVACGNCGSDTQTCSVSGAWQSSGMCLGQGACHSGDSQSCNTYGTQSCSASCGWGACSCASAPVCTPNAKQCLGGGVRTCDQCGQWGGAVACTSDQTCLNGACAAMFASCQTGGNPLTCPAGSSLSCCASPEVTPNGAFYRTYANSGGGPTGEADPATVSGFRLDQYLVTVARFRRFVSAWNGGSGWKPPPGSGSHTHAHAGLGLANSASAGSYETGWVATDDNNVAPTNTNLLCDSAFQTWTASAGNYDAMPINCVNWYEAYAFCIWDGGFLPSEAEWEYAAAGGSLQRQYPWGSTAPGSYSYYAICGCVYQGGGVCEGVQNIAPVGTAAQGAGLWGQYDLAGNVFEWNLDWYSAYTDPCTDCAYLTPTGDRVTRGGDYSSSPSGLLPPNRTTALPTTRAGNIGFRCARTP